MDARDDLPSLDAIRQRMQAIRAELIDLGRLERIVQAAMRADPGDLIVQETRAIVARHTQRSAERRSRRGGGSAEILKSIMTLGKQELLRRLDDVEQERQLILGIVRAKTAAGQRAAEARAASMTEEEMVAEARAAVATTHRRLHKGGAK